ncbi:hypothetical protein MKW94_030428 [Papaver nudicaule]|uniref:Uncharacterized protein n=1 Tax=Papaver nudicaule TaxID=74823 RepID=A0AA41VDD2_PAPNU|nr:hypothetical protein [Papaver nudicaule]
MDPHVDFWKKKFSEAQNQFWIQRGEDELEIKELKDKVRLQEKKMVEFVAVIEEGKTRVSTAENEINKYKTMCEELSKRIEESKRKHEELVGQADLRLKYELDLKQELKVCKAKYDKKKARGISLEKELNQYKSTCIQLNKRIESLNNKLNGKKAEDLEREKRRAEDEPNVSNARFRELESQAELLQRELDIYKDKCNGLSVELQQKEMEMENELNQYKSTCIQLNKRIKSLEEDNKQLNKNKVVVFEHDEPNVSNARFRELESRAALLLKELDVCKGKCNGLSAELKQKEMESAWYESKLKNLTVIKDALEDKSEGYQTAFSGLREQIIGLADERKAIREREKEAEERVAYLDDVIKKMQSDNKETEMQDLRLEQDSTLKCSNSHDYGETEGERKGLQNDETYNNKGKEAINRQLDSEMNGGTNDALAPLLTTNKNMLNNTKHILTSDVPASSSSFPHGNEHELVSGPLSTEKQFKPLIPKVESGNLLLVGPLSTEKQFKPLIPKVESGNLLLVGPLSTEKQLKPLIPKVESGNGARMKIDFELEERSLFVKGCSNSEKSLVPYFKRPFPGQKGCEYDITCTAEDIPSSSAPKRRMLSKFVANDSESEEEDTTLNGKHKVKFFEELAASPEPQTYPVNPCAGDATFSSGVYNVEEFITSSRQSFFSLRKCIEKKSQVDGTSQEKRGKLAAAKDEKKVIEKTADNKNSSRDSEDAADTGIDFDTIIAAMRRNRNEKS